MTGALANVEHLIISSDRVPVAAYQAIYHKLTSNVETINEIFADAYDITIDDLVQLDHLLHQAILQYPVQSKNSKCGVSLRKNEKIEPSSFEKFKVFNFNTMKPTSKFSYSFDFFTVLPVELREAENIVQRFKLSLVIDQDFIEDSDGIPHYFRSVVCGNNIAMKVEYSDYNVGRNIQVTVQDWVSSLPTRKIPKVVSFFENKSDFFCVMIPRAFLLFSFVGLIFSPIDSLFDTFIQNIFFGLALGTASFILGHILCVELYRNISEVKPLTFIYLTKGDRDRADIMKARRKMKARWATFFGATIIVGLLVNLLSSFLFEALTKSG